jgi:hypothetical protein
MSTAVRWIIAVLVIAVLAWLLWWSGWLTNKKMAMAPATTNMQATTTPPAPTNGMSASNDASDAAITQDTAAIDTQMQGYSSDTSNVDTSMNDKQISQ